MSGHLNLFLLERLANGELSTEDLARLLLDHVGQECPKCLAALRDASSRLGLDDSSEHAAAHPGLSFWHALDHRHRRQDEDARRLLGSLEAAGEQAAQVVAEGPAEELANPALARRLLTRAWSACHTRRSGGRALGLAAAAVGRRLGEAPFSAEISFGVRLAGLTVAAEAARLESRFAIALALLAEARELVEDVADPSVLTDFFRVCGVTELAAGRTGEAAASLELAEKLAEDAVDPVLVARARLARTEVLEREAGPRQALRSADEILDRLPHGVIADPRTELVRLIARARRIELLLAAGETATARAELGEVGPSGFLHYGHTATFHWLAGRAAHAGDDPRTALDHLEAARVRLQTDGSAVEAGLVLAEIADSAIAARRPDIFDRAGVGLARLIETADDPIALAKLREILDRYLDRVA